MKDKFVFAILLIFFAASAAGAVPSERCKVQIEIKNRFKRETRKTYYFDAKNEEECARFAAEHEAAPKPAYILKRTVKYEFR
ncbi:MAG: hypothetical protein HYW49_03105 [Deltaproteobacteria bacterium]|nr:hypothetical protein [Deltaproteobacteria bacterium]